VRAPTPNPFVSRRFAQRGAVALALLLGLWIFAFASHVHALEDHGAPHQSAQHCAFCLALPGAAAAPEQLSLPATEATHCPPLAAAAIAVCSETFSYYQGRAPPVS
jgi:hypothetical protein